MTLVKPDGTFIHERLYDGAMSLGIFNDLHRSESSSFPHLFAIPFPSLSYALEYSYYAHSQPNPVMSLGDQRFRIAAETYLDFLAYIDFSHQKYSSLFSNVVAGIQSTTFYVILHIPTSEDKEQVP